LAHHGLIRILIEDSLQNLRIPIKWLVFRDLLAKDVIKTLTYDVCPSISKEEAKKEEDIELDGDEMDGEETNTEEHDEREHKEDNVEAEEEMKQETNGNEK